MKQFSLILITILIQLSIVFSNDCQCDQEVTITKEDQPDLKFAEDELIVETDEGQVNHGRLIQIGNYVQLVKSFPVKKSWSTIQASCPSGFRVAKESELQEIHQYVIDNDLMERFMTEGEYRVHNDPNPVIYAAFDMTENWIYRSYTIAAETLEITYDTVHTYWTNSDSENPEDWKLFAKCIMTDDYYNSAGFGQFIDGYIDKDFVECDYRSYTINSGFNIINSEWTLPNGQTSTGTTADIIAYKSEKKCGKYQVDLTFFGGYIISFCKTFHTIAHVDDSNSNDLFQSASSVTKVVLPNITAKKNNSMHFSHGTAPLTPIPGGGAYILYSEDTDEQDLHVLKIDNDGNIELDIPIGNQGSPLDITATPYGFVILVVKPVQHAYIEAWNLSEDGTSSKRWQQTVVNNGDSPDENTQVDQVDLGGGFGVSVMFKPHNGRLQYARGRLLVVFAHYNFFGYYENGNRNVHTGDTAYTVDAYLGNDIQVVWGWATSHSLRQSSVYDGKNIYVSSLGDAYPQSIKTHKINGLDTSLNVQGKQLFTPDLIPGNGGGKACGRVGGTTLMNSSKHAMTWAQRPCDITFQGNPTSSDVDTLSVVFFNEDSFLSEPVSAGQFKIANGKWVTAIRSAKYGNNLLVGYTELAQDRREQFEGLVAFGWGLAETGETMKIALVSSSGSVLKSVQMDTSSMSAQEDWQTLSDGRVAWTYVNVDRELEYHFVPKTQTNDDEINRLEQICSTGQAIKKPSSQVLASKKEEKNEGLSGGAIAAIVIIVVLVIGIVAGAFGYYFIKQRQLKVIVGEKTEDEEKGEMQKVKVQDTNPNNKD